ncbi:MAG: hypothetical protein Q9168_006865, partial [Polycauliona sp. 1 TL-2023]
MHSSRRLLTRPRYCWGIEIPPDIMSDEDMRSIWDTTKLLIFMMNDIFSLPKELKQSQVDSLIPLLYKRYGTLETAMEKANQILHESVAALELSAEKLLARYGTDSELRRKIQQTVHGCQCACTANVNWSVVSRIRIYINGNDIIASDITSPPPLLPPLTHHLSPEAVTTTSPTGSTLVPTFLAMEVLSTAPTQGQFTPLSAHQSQTPPSFHSGPPVLHHHSPSTTISINSRHLQSAPAFHKLIPPPRLANASAHVANDEASEDTGEEIAVPGVDVWVTSEYAPRALFTSTYLLIIDPNPRKLLLFSPTFSTGVSIPYPSISLHAIQRSPTIHSLLLQLLCSPGPQFDDHDPEGTVSLAIILNANGYTNESPPPTPITRPVITNPVAEAMVARETQPTPVEQLFSALSACADLHPDHDGDSDFDLEERNTQEDSGALYTQID